MLSLIQKFSSILSRYTSPFIIGIAALAFVLPGLFTWVQGDIQAMVLGFIMLTMGLTLRPADFRILAARPLDIFIGALAQFSIMPLVAWGLVHCFDLPRGIAAGLILVPLCTKGIQKGVKSMEKRDKKWGELFSNAMFLGMISAFLGYVFCDVAVIFKGESWGLTPVCVMICSAVVMLVCGLASRFEPLRWLIDYALPLSLIGGMAMAIPLTAWLGAAPV